MLTTWKPNVRGVSDGETVNQVNANKAKVDLTQRTDYLKDRIDAFQGGTALTIFDAVLDSSTAVGTPVYWNSSSAQFDPAQATYTLDPSTGERIFDESAFVHGVVISKSTSTIGNVATFGYVTGVDITGVVGASPSGIYYLSETVAGTYETTKPDSAIAVIYVIDDDTFRVESNLGNFVNSVHQHVTYDLQPVAAGTVTNPSEGGQYTFSSELAGTEGWLPVSNSVFDGLTKPSGAVYGYNKDQNADLAAAWDLLPKDSITLLLNGIAVAQGTDQLLVINEDGIWWLSDYYGYAPWKETVADPSDPEDFDYTMQLLTTHVGENTDLLVLSLVGESPITVTDCDDEPASAGPLKVSIDPFTSSTGTDDYTCVQSLTREAITLGNKASSIKSLSELITISGTSLGDGKYAGDVEIDFDESLASRRGGMELVALNDVGERSVNGVPMLLLPNRASSITARIDVPDITVPSSNKLTLTFWLHAPIAGTPDDMDVTGRVLSKPGSGTALPTTDDLSAALNPGAKSAGHYFEMSIDSFTTNLSSGDSVLLTIARSAGGSYDDNIGVVKMRWEVVPV